MGKASRRKRAEPIRISDTPLPNQRQYGNAWLRKLLPAGEEPIATRDDKGMGRLHVACASGQAFVFTYAALEAAERESEARLPVDFLSNEAAVMVQRMLTDNAPSPDGPPDECRCVPPGEDGDPDAPPCKLHPNGDGKQPKPPRPHPTEGPWPWTDEQDEIAEARLIEAWVIRCNQIPADHRCELCDIPPSDGAAPAEVLALDNLDQPWGVHRKCLVERNGDDRLRLDCDPEQVKTSYSRDD